MEKTTGIKPQRNPYLMNLVSTHEPTFRQGHVGDLSSKTQVEIEELLQRQEKLLASKAFVAKLPDRGAKISQFVSKLRGRLDELKQVESNTESIEVEVNFVNTTDDPSASTTGRQLEHIETSHQLSTESDLAIVEKGFSNLTIHEGPHYDVVKKAALKPKKSKFSLNRQREKAKKEESTNEKNNSQNEIDMKAKTSTTHSSNQAASKSSSEPVLSAATISSPKNKTVVISVEECRDLHKRQQEIIKEQQSRRAAERFMAKYGMGDFSDPTYPEGSLSSVTEESSLSEDDVLDEKPISEDVLDLEEVD